MKYRFTNILTVCIGLSTILFAMGSCGLNTAILSEAGKADVKPATIKVWTNNASSKTEDLKMVYDYNSGPGKEKGIYIDYKIFAGDYVNILETAMAINEGPDIFKNNISSSSIPILVRNGWIVAIEDMPGGRDFLKKYEGKLQPIINTFNGKTYTVPFAITTMAVAYNKDLLRKNGFTNPPATWTEMREMAKVITKNGKGREFGFIEGLKANVHSQNGLYQYFSSVGHATFNNETGKFNFTDFMPFYNMWMGMETDGSIFPGCEDLNNDQARSQFAEGNIGFKFSASYDVGVWTDQFPARMNWGICRPVENPSARYKNYAYQIPSLVFGKNSLEMPEKSMEVFKLWNSDKAMLKLYEGGKYIPYDNNITSMAKKGSKIKNWEEFADLSNTTISLPNPTGEINLEGDIDAIVIPRILKGEIGVEEGLKDLEKRYNTALDKAVSEGLDLTPYLDKNMNVK